MKCQSCGAYLNPAWMKCLVCNTPTIFKAKLKGCELSDEEREDYNEYIEIILCPEHETTLTFEAAHSLAIELVFCFSGNLRKGVNTRRNISDSWEWKN